MAASDHNLLELGFFLDNQLKKAKLKATEVMNSKGVTLEEHMDIALTESSIADDVVTVDVKKALSANQGKVLKSLITNLEQLGHVLGTVANVADLPATLNDVFTLWGLTPTVNDYVDVQTDGNNDDLATAYKIVAIQPGGVIQWANAPFRTYSTKPRDFSVDPITGTEIDYNELAALVAAMLGGNVPGGTPGTGGDTVQDSLVEFITNLIFEIINNPPPSSGDPTLTDAIKEYITSVINEAVGNLNSSNDLTEAIQNFITTVVEESITNNTTNNFTEAIQNFITNVIEQSIQEGDTNNLTESIKNFIVSLVDPVNTSDITDALKAWLLEQLTNDEDIKEAAGAGQTWTAVIENENELPDNMAEGGLVLLLTPQS